MIFLQIQSGESDIVAESLPNIKHTRGKLSRITETPHSA